MKTRRMAVCLASCVIAVALSGCNRDDSAHASASAAEQAAALKAAEFEARERQLAQREAEIKAKEAEQEQLRRAEAEAAEREAARVAAAKEAAAKQAAAKQAAAKRAAEARMAAAAAATPSRSSPPAAVAVQAPLRVPAGTQLVVALAADVSTKTAKVGDRFEARLVSSLMSGDRLVAPAGARVTGTIIEAISGSHQIGAVPALGMRFDQLELLDDRQVSIRGELQQLGESEKGTDAAKIIGGAAAGAVIGHQIKHGTKGKVIGGILGGAAGAMVAKNTGTEVQLPAGSQLTVVLDEAFEVAST
jgi:outer membrane lipoprotein SlyB